MGRFVPHSSWLYRDEWAASPCRPLRRDFNYFSNSGSVVVEAAPAVLLGRCGRSPLYGVPVDATPGGPCPRTRSSRWGCDERGTAPDAAISGPPAIVGGWWPLRKFRVLGSSPAGTRRSQDKREIPGTPSNPRSKLKILLIPWICMTATWSASRADNPL